MQRPPEREEFLLKLRGKHEVSVSLFLGGESGEDVAADAEVR